MADSTLIWAPTRPADAGVFYRAPLGSTLPTDATSALDAAFLDHGWLGEDGITLTVTRDTTKHKSFGGDTVKVTQDDFDEELSLVLLETNPTVLGTVWGSTNVTVGGVANQTLDIVHSPLMLERSAFVLEVIDGSKTRRLVIQEGQVTGLEDLNYQHTALLGYGITISTYKPASGNAAAVVEYVNDVGVSAPGS